MPTSFIESGFTTRVEYDKWVASGGGAADTKGSVIIRGMAISGNGA
jgi:hypothetical protein